MKIVRKPLLIHYDNKGKVTMNKTLQELNLEDDFLFAKVMSG